MANDTERLTFYFEKHRKTGMTLSCSDHEYEEQAGGSLVGLQGERLKRVPCDPRWYWCVPEHRGIPLITADPDAPYASPRAAIDNAMEKKRRREEPPDAE